MIYSKTVIFYLLIAGLWLPACNKQEKVTCEQNCSINEELIFQTGFEPSTEGLPTDAIEVFSGVDSSVAPPNDWVKNLDDHPNIGAFNIQYQGGDTDRKSVV